jgi:ABC-type transporter Mla maintaining outer membrane lipid asymmetry ATPase subunit MlaF
MSGPTPREPVLEISGIRKNYSALRPLRLQSLTVAAGERVAISGLDAGAAEVFVNLVTGASLADEGHIRVLGHSTADIADGDAWLASLDRFGIMSQRAVLLEGATLAQNLAMPFTLEIDPVDPDMLRTVRTLAEECGITGEWLDQAAARLPPGLRSRAHLCRALALRPALLLLEHPTSTIADVTERRAFAADIVRVCDARAQTMVAVTMDQEFAVAVAHRALVLQPATGVLAPVRKKWLW